MLTELDEDFYDECRCGNLQEAKWLLAAGADINAFVSGDTPIIASVWRGHLDVVQFLLDNGASINRLDHTG